MSKKQFKSQASSSRVTGSGSGFGFTSPSAAFGSASSALSYLAEQPDLSTLADANLVVQFKNLSKKDSTTKTRALEDILSYATSLRESQTDIEGAFLDAWIKVYPRASIDLDRRVRQLAHQSHGVIFVTSGKKAARYMSICIGAWVTGCHDSDRSVSRAATDSFSTVFPTLEKQESVNKIYQSAILDFCQDALLKESPQSLSDERFTKAEDADAKYLRLVSSALLVVRTLLEKLQEADIQKRVSNYDQLIDSEQLWAFASSKDSSVRRSLYRLVQTSLSRVRDLILPKLPQILGSLLSKMVIKRQSGSALEFSSVLVAVCNANPQVWLSIFKDSASASSTVVDLVRQGSQGASSSYWVNISNLFTTIPVELLPTNPELAIMILSALRSGITRKEEPRSHAEDSWACYTSVTAPLMSQLPSDGQDKVSTEMIIPIIRQYLQPSAEDSAWTLPAAEANAIVIKLLHLPSMINLSPTLWPSMAEKLIEDVRTSAPEQSKEFQSSQTAVSKKGVRWFELQAQMSSSELRYLDESNQKIVSESIDTLRARNGKPFGAADVIEAGLRVRCKVGLDQEPAEDLIDKFLISDLPSLIFSPSRASLISILYAAKDTSRFSEAWHNTLKAVLDAADSPEQLSTLKMLLQSPGMQSMPRVAVENEKLQAFFSAVIDRVVDGGADWETLAPFFALSTTVLSTANTDKMLTSLTQNLTLKTKASGAMAGLETMAEQDSRILVDFIKTTQGHVLMQNVLLLSESQDDNLAFRAKELNSNITMAFPQSRENDSSSATRGLILRSLYETTSNSLGVETLIDIAQREMDKSELPAAELAQHLIPSAERWEKALQAIIDNRVPQAMAISTPLGSLGYLIDDSRFVNDQDSPPRYDRAGYSGALRMGVFTVALTHDDAVWQHIPVPDQADIYRLLLITSQLANDQLTITGSNDIWLAQHDQIENEMLDFVSKTNKLLKHWLTCASDDTISILSGSEPLSFTGRAHDKLFADTRGRSNLAYHAARAVGRSISEMIEIHGWDSSLSSSPSSVLETRLKELKKDLASPMTLVAYVTAFESPLSATPTYTRTCNELVASLTAADIGKAPDLVITQLILLNTLLQGQDYLVHTIAKQRLIFFVKHTVPWLDVGVQPTSIQAEIAKSFAIILPAMKDVYGDHWLEIIKHVEVMFKGTSTVQGNISLSPQLPLLHASLRMISILRFMVDDDDGNDDLKEAWQESAQSISMASMSLLKELSVLADVQNQPLRSVNELLGRQIAAFPPTKLDRLEDLYQLVTVESHSIHRTAFELLHGRIPEMQEQLSVDVALAKSVTRLPDELLSLVLEAPTLDSLVDASFDREMPQQVRGYLSGWLLVFDHFKNASEKVRNDYISHLKDDEFLTPLLNFTFDFLGHSRGKPVDPTKFEVTVYSFDVQEEPVKDLQWLLIHLYYLCLKRTPTLVKNWWMDCKSRQTVVNVESWTEKYISPEIIADALNTVRDWAATQDTASDEALTIKTNPRAKEITLAKELDGQLLALAIKLPPTYPLGLATCHTVNRVAVDPKKWETWRLNTQGVIAFSNNSLIEGIVAFRRNVGGALKGQTECAICYSIVGADKQLPTKRCGTCKNLFHGSCLYRWFKSSNSSSCPLCRNSFNYT